MKEMDLEHVLFGLSPFVNDCEDKKLNVDNVYKDSYLKLLDQLAVLLRDEATRNHDLIKSNLSKLIGAGNYLLLNLDDVGYKDLLLELIRVLANAIADNEVNREILASNSEFIKNLSYHLVEKPKEDSLNERILILLKNLVIDSPDAAEEISFITQDVLNYIFTTSNDIFVAVDLLTDLIKYMKYKIDAENIGSLNSILLKTLADQLDFDEDEFSELVVNISNVLEDITVNPKFNFSDDTTEQILQAGFADTLRSMEKAEFQNRLMAQRRIFASIGNVSANISTNNKTLRDPSILIIKDPEEKNGYIISSSFTILGNSVSSASDRNEILEKEPTLVEDILSKYNYLVDPVQFQGLLHILKTLISIDSVSLLFSDKNFGTLVLLIEATVRNSKYYTNFTTLLVSFLKKLFVLVNKRHVEKIVGSDIPQVLVSADSNTDINIILLLLLNKIVIYLPDANIEAIVSKIFKFNNNNIQASYLFELTKTVGVLLQHKAEYILDYHSSKLITLLTTVDSIDPSSVDNAAKAVLNNGRYLSGSLLKTSETRSIDPELLELSKKLLRK